MSRGRGISRGATALAAVVLLAAGAWAQYQIPGYQSAPQDLPRAVGTQPVPFNHKVHAENSIACLDCHKGAERKWVAGLPDLKDCMVCHGTIATDNADVQKVTQLVDLGVKKVDWVRVYDLPDFVFFNHKQHTVKAGLACAECHGPVETREVLAQEVSINMIACMKCHGERGASNECFLCHELGQ